MAKYMFFIIIIVVYYENASIKPASKMTPMAVDQQREAFIRLLSSSSSVEILLSSKHLHFQWDICQRHPHCSSNS